MQNVEWKNQQRRHEIHSLIFPIKFVCTFKRKGKKNYEQIKIR